MHKSIIAEDKTHEVSMCIEKEPAPVGAFEIVDRATLQAIRDAEALGVWVYLRSLPENWRVNETQVCEHFGFGRHTYLKAMKALREVGAVERVAIPGKGGKVAGSKLLVKYTAESPIHRPSEKPTVGESDPLKNTEGLKNTERNKSPLDAQPSLPGCESPNAGAESALPAGPILLPVDWQPSPRVRAWMASNGVHGQEDQDRIIADFRAYWRETGTRRKNWDLTFIKNPVVKGHMAKLRLRANEAHQSTGRAESRTDRAVRLRKETEQLWLDSQAVDH